jgi:hypothetical protein
MGRRQGSPLRAPPSSGFPNRTTFVIASFCASARQSPEIDNVCDENASKNDAYHINQPKTRAASAAQICEHHGLTRWQRKYALPEIATLHRFVSV